MGLMAATSIGIGGMIGAGIFSLLGLAAGTAGTQTYLAFLLAGLIALFCAYSFGKLGARFPSAGGPVEYLVRGAPNRLIAGVFNLLLWLGYVIVNALYARTFGEYAVALIGMQDAGYRQIVVSGFACGIVAVFLALNRLGADSVGRAEIVLVIFKIAILLSFSAGTALSISKLDAVPTMGELPSILFTAGLVFMAYEGFGLVTNAAEDMRNVKRNLPRALMISVCTVAAIYAVVAIVVTGTLSPEVIREAEEYALAEAARPIFGSFGFTAIAIAALISTASAINATLYGGANVSYIMAQRGHLPVLFQRRLWQVARGGLLITSFLIVFFAIAFPIEKIAMAGSLAFLLVYGAVNFAHLRLRHETGGRLIPIVIGFLGCVAGFVALAWHIVTTAPLMLLAFVVLLGASLAGELYMRRDASERSALSERKSQSNIDQ